MGVQVNKAKSQCHDQQHSQLEAVWAAEQTHRKGVCAALVEEDLGIYASEECSKPCFSGAHQFDIPGCEHPNLAQVVSEFPELFTTKPGKTTAEYHYILTTGCPVKCPPHRIPAHYREEVEQLQNMLNQGII